MLFRIFRVSGDSMLPTLADGDFVLAKKLNENYLDGNVVIINDTAHGFIIKRIKELNKREFAAYGDNKDSNSDQCFGMYTPEDLKFIVKWKVGFRGISKI